MPCFKDANGGRTPDEIEYIREHGLGGIEQRWQQFLGKRFPSGLGGTDVAGICVASLDSGIAGCISAALDGGKRCRTLDPERLGILRSHIGEIKTVVDNLQGYERAYFEDLLWLAMAVLDVCDDKHRI